MPVPINIDKVPQEKVWYIDYVNYCNSATGSNLVYKAFLPKSFAQNDRVDEFIVGSLEKQGTTHNWSNKLFIKLSNVIKAQYELYTDYYVDIHLDEIMNISAPILSELILLNPDAFSLELTNEESIFYTFKKDDYSFYFQHYFETEADGFNASMVSFKGDKKLESTSGNIVDLIDKVKCSLTYSTPHNINSSLFNELSY